MPRDTNGKKMSVDALSIAFVVEKDGRAGDVNIIGDAAPQLIAAIKEAFDKCKNWLPSRLYGIPLRTRMTFPLSFYSGYTDVYHNNNDVYVKQIKFKEEVEEPK